MSIFSSATIPHHTVFVSPSRISTFDTDHAAYISCCVAAAHENRSFSADLVQHFICKCRPQIVGLASHLSLSVTTWGFLAFLGFRFCCKIKLIMLGTCSCSY